jgi:hypothetical protein
MKTFLIALLVIIVLAVIGFGGWYYFLKKSSEGGKCTADARCEVGKCVSGKCSSGKINSPCSTYNDCEAGLLCLKKICSEKPDFSQYFEKIVISKMKPGLPPGPSNPTTITTEFKINDSIEVDVTGVKPTTQGSFYFELVDANTGEVAVSTESRQGAMSISGQDIGTGTDLSGTAPGKYDLNFYFNNELLYTTSITIS